MRITFVSKCQFICYRNKNRVPSLHQRQYSGTHFSKFLSRDQQNNNFKNKGFYYKAPRFSALKKKKKLHRCFAQWLKVNVCNSIFFFTIITKYVHCVDVLPQKGCTSGKRSMFASVFFVLLPQLVSSKALQVHAPESTHSFPS